MTDSLAESNLGRSPTAVEERPLVVKVGQHPPLVLPRKGTRLRALAEDSQPEIGQENSQPESTVGCLVETGESEPAGPVSGLPLGKKVPPEWPDNVVSGWRESATAGEGRKWIEENRKKNA